MSVYILQENEAKKARALKKIDDERELTEIKDREIQRYVNTGWPKEVVPVHVTISMQTFRIKLNRFRHTVSRVSENQY